MTKKVYLSALPYCLWLFLFVLAPIALLVYKSFFDIHNQLTLANYATYFTSWTYLKMSLNSVIYATIISFVTLVISYPAAYFLTKLKHKQLWLMLIILPTWINLLLKAYAVIGIFGKSGAVNQFLAFFGIGSQQLLFTDFAFIFVASYIEIPFMILPIFNAIDDIDQNLVKAGYDLGATRLQNFTQIIFPLSMNGVRSGVQAVFIPSLSLFMLTRLIGGNRVITLGTAKPSQQVDGDDVEAVFDAMRGAVEEVRRGSGPHFIEMLTYRFRGHSMGDPQRYRKKEEVEHAKLQDPINRFEH